MVTSINNNGDINFLYDSQAKEGKSGESLDKNKVYPPVSIHDTLELALKKDLFLDNIKDTTGAILEQIKAQMEGKGSTLALDQAGAEEKSLQAANDLSRQGDKGLVQANRDFLRPFQG